MINVLVNAYAVNPYWGSEQGMLSEVNRLVKQFEQSRKMMKQMPGLMGGKGKFGKKGMFGKLPF